MIQSVSEVPSTAVHDVDVVVLGASISGLMMAGHLCKYQPELDILVVGPNAENEKRPIVGESLLEPATYFFHSLGLADYLRREHIIKQGLSFYYKFAPDDPTDRRYTVHSPEQLHKLSRQLHRPRFDHDLRDHVAQLGVKFLEGMAREWEIGAGDQRHRLTVTSDRGPVQLNCRWLVDATGRNRWLGRRVTKYLRPHERQRSSFWFRLANFKQFFDDIELSKRRDLKYDLWYTTHHFMGRGYFIWVIPLQSPEHESAVSIGITYRPDLFDHPMRSMNDFLDFVDGEHPAVSKMVRSGEVLDTQTYGNFLYWAEQIYSPDGWFLVGDSARAVDPLYSTGLSQTVVQVEQINEIISRQKSGMISDKQIMTFQELWKSIAHQRQDDITTLYERMGDPFQACMRRYWNNITWFNLLLPLWWNGLFHDVDAAPVLLKLFQRAKPMQMAANRLFAQASMRLGDGLTQEDYDRAADFDYLLNPHWDCPPDKVPQYFAQVFRKRAYLRRNLLRMTGYRDLLGQLPALTSETALTYLMPLILRTAAPRAFSNSRAQPPSRELAKATR